ncbi:UNVERIFIED_CONTAM: hypothetical protein FKN15_073468 [Acipenser sinensis]
MAEAFLLHQIQSLFVFVLQEKQDKVILLTEVSNLRENNQRLQKESVSANEQLKKFSHIYTSSMERK